MQTNKGQLKGWLARKGKNQWNTWWMYEKSKVSQSWDVHSNSLFFAQRMKCLLKVDADFSVVGRFSSCSGNNGAVSSQSWKRCRCVGGWKDERILTLSFLFLSCSFPKTALARGILTSIVRVGIAFWVGLAFVGIQMPIAEEVSFCEP